MGFSAPPIPVLEIAEQNGVDVVFTGFGALNNKVAGFCDFQNAKIYVNCEDSISRQSFTMAHELDHWLLHKDYYKSNPEEYPILPRFQTVDKNNALEQEANHFAANLLVPKRLLLPVINAPAPSLAKVFNVSRIMMEYRIKNIRSEKRRFFG